MFLTEYVCFAPSIVASVQANCILMIKGHFKVWINLLKPNDIYTSYPSANLQTLHFKYLFNKYT